jgi:outer membrane protein insertion porin family
VSGLVYFSVASRFCRVAGVALLLLAVASGTPARAQERPTDGVNIKRVEVRGLKTLSESYVLRIVKTRPNQPFRRDQLAEDVRELLRTRKFLDVSADEKTEDGQAVIVFLVEEKPSIATVEIDGNKQFTDEDLFKELSFAAGSPTDLFEIGRGRENILRKYKEKGYYFATVELDEPSLQAESRVVYRVVEGPRVKVREILFENATSFPEPRLRLMTKSKTYFPILSVGALDEEQADRDAIEMQTFYRNEGYLDARVGYRLDFESVDRSRLNLVFVFEEGPRYTIREVRIRGAEVFDETRVRELLTLKPGDFLRDEVLKEDVKRVENLYGEIGYVVTRVNATYDFVEAAAGQVVLNLDIIENTRSRFGRITVRGNSRTRDEVVRRELRFYPGEDFNTVAARDAERRLRDTGLFNRATITPLDDNEGEREALVEVEEAETVTFNIGAGISTDNGISGLISIENRNFDIFDTPRTFGEFLRGQSFRGDGQRMRVQLEPGSEVSRFRIDFTEPYFLDRPLRLDLSAYLFQRDRTSYDEARIGFTPAISKRFESGLLRGWAIEGALRLEAITIDNLRTLASNQIRDVRGDSTLTSVKGSIVRDTSDSRIVPSRGSRFVLSWEQVGALGGDYDFAKPTASFTYYHTLRTDVLDRKSVLALRADTGFIGGDAPVFERFYAGGFGSVRGFSFRGITPRAGIFNDKVGGDFIFLLGGEYSFPLYADNVRGVAFLDMGTVEKDFELTGWRASVGFGMRVNLSFFGPVPLVFDFGFPIAEEDGDDTRVFNFSIGASF